LLLDQNLSYKLCKALADLCPDIAHARRLALDRSSDVEIWQYAFETNREIITMDADFADLAGLRGSPPIVIWLRCGNQPTSVVEAKLRSAWPMILDAMGSGFDLVELY
jgi:predicted nuclease of predicted toxin-antitoxin system